jgi:translation initiation factor RLI1
MFRLLDAHGDTEPIAAGIAVRADVFVIDVPHARPDEPTAFTVDRVARRVEAPE